MAVAVNAFGTRADGTPVREYLLSSPVLRLSLINYGMRMLALQRYLGGGEWRQLLLGLPGIEACEADNSYLGAVVGPVANRVRDGQCRIGNTSLNLDRNEGNHHLHGGFQALHNRCWQIERLGADSVAGHIHCEDGEGGYPGDRHYRVEITLAGDTLSWKFQASGTRDCPVNLVNHNYYNLDGKGDVLGHRLRLAADRFVPVDEEMLPVGDLATVAGTPFDFRSEQAVGEVLGRPHAQLDIAGGLDHAFVLDPGVAWPIRLSSSDGRVQLWMQTSLPGVQLYTGNHLVPPRAGLCLETGYFPDAPNHPQFPSATLQPGVTWEAVTRVRVSTDA